jgi:uncharacterized OB-fold protein
MDTRTRNITAYRCPLGCLFLYRHQRCPNCSGLLLDVRLPGDAVLLTHTTVHVTPTGQPVRLGIAEVRRGLRTLCIVEGGVRGNGRDRVQLVVRDGRYIAVASQARLTSAGRTAASRED